MENTIYYLMIILGVLGSLFAVAGSFGLFLQSKAAEESRRKIKRLSIVILILGILAIAFPVSYTIYLQIGITSSSSSYETSLEGLAESGDYDGVLELLESGADPDQTYQKGDGNPPFLCAAINGDIEMAKLLLDYGADVDSADSSGKTALFFAASDSTSTKMLEFLIENGADVTHTSNNGVTAAHIAAGISNSEAVKILVENGADAAAVTVAGNSVLYYACTVDSELVSCELLKYLVENGADVTYTDSSGNDYAAILKNSQTAYIANHAEDEDFDNDKQNEAYNEAIKYMKNQITVANNKEKGKENLKK